MLVLRQRLGARSDVRYLLGDIRDRYRLKRAMEGVDIVFHAAALQFPPNNRGVVGAGTQTQHTTRLPTTVGGTGRHVQPNYLEMDDQEHWEQAKKKW